MGKYDPLGISTRTVNLEDELMGETLLTRFAVLVSRTYAVVSVVGHNVAGRIYTPGSQQPRHLVLNAYTSSHSKVI